MEVVAFVKVCAIEPPVPLAAPVIFGALTVQASTVPETAVADKVMFAGCCEQILAFCGEVLTTGTAFTNTAADPCVELQIPACAVT